MNQSFLKKRHPIFIIMIAMLIFYLFLFFSNRLPDFKMETNNGSVDYLGMVSFFILTLLLISTFIFLAIRAFEKLKQFHMNSIPKFFLSLIRDKRKWISLLVFFFIPLVAMCMEYVFSHSIRVVPLSTGRLFNWYRYAFLTALLYVIFILTTTQSSITMKPEKTFLSLSLTIGLLIILTVPNIVYVTWDDQKHYYNINNLVGINRFHKTQADHLLTNDLLFKDEFEDLITFNISEKNSVQKQLGHMHNQGFVTEGNISYRQTYQSIAYYPAVMFLAVGRALSLPYPMALMLGKVAILLSYSITMYFAIKKLRTGKMILATIALIPTCMLQASTFNYDYWIICMTALGFSYYFTILQTPVEEINKKDLMVSLLALVLGLGPKAIYFPLLFLLFIQSKRYKKWFSIALVVSIVFVMASFVVPFISDPDFVTDVRGGSDVNSLEQVKYILQNPFAYTKTLFQFLTGYLSLDNTHEYLIFFAYLGMGVANNLILLTLIFTSMTDNNEYNRDKRFGPLRTKVFTVSFITILLFVTALYVSFNPVGSSSIEGCQPRYLLPLLFPVLYVMGSTKTIQCNLSKKTYHTIIFSICSFVLLCGYWVACISRYY